MPAERRFGPRISAEGTEFRLWAPSVDAVSLAIGDGAPQPMRARDGGWFSLEAAAPPGTRYAFVLPDGMRVPDPASRAQAGDVHDASIVSDIAGYAWQHRDWNNRSWHEAVILEVHVGLAGGFAALRDDLPRIAALGVTAIELMPIADFPGTRNWGYDGVLPYAPDASYGTPEGLCALIDAAHGHGLMVLLDVVYNHFGPDGAYLHVYAKEFFDPEVHTPWGAAIDFARDEVFDYFAENALMWLNDYRFDGLRFDAVHAIAPQSALKRLAERLRDEAERPVHLVLEHEENRASLLRASPSDKLYDAQWSDDWHHCVHVLLTGESEGYYESFAQDPTAQLARALAEGFVFQGEVSPHHGHARGEPSAHLPTSAFVIALQNHDQIGNRAFGERLASLAEPQALRAAMTLLLLAPFVPLLFMGEEWASTRPFLFFTDHHGALADAVREGRRREFKRFSAFQDPQLRERIADPNDKATFERSRLDANEIALPEHASFLELTRSLLALRAAHVIPGIPGARSAGARALARGAVSAAWHLGNDSRLTLATNFTDQPVPLDPPAGRLLMSSGLSPQSGELPQRTTLAFLERAG